MKFVDELDDLKVRFPTNGNFQLTSVDSIRQLVNSGVPDSYGIYLIFAGVGRKRLIYVGKSGTINCDGSLKTQGLKGRLVNKQGGIPRKKYFAELLQRPGIPSLEFVWFVTHDKSTKVIPAYVEMMLLQAYYAEFGCLPILNACA